MKKWIIQTSIALLALFAVDRLGGAALNWMIKNQKSGAYWTAKQKLVVLKPELAILGSSRAEAHYNTDMIEERLHITAMNYGVAGSGLVCDYVLLSIMTDNNPALKKVILDVRPYEFGTGPDFYELKAMNNLAPYSPLLNDILINQIPGERVKCNMSSLYMYNNQVPEIIRGYLKKTDPNKKITGYNPSPHTDFKAEFGKMEAKPVYKENMAWIDSIYNKCKTKNIELLVCVSPWYGDVSAGTTIPALKKYCMDKNIVFANYASDTEIISHQDYFRDQNHLNTTGADIYTAKIIKDLLEVRK